MRRLAFVTIVAATIACMGGGAGPEGAARAYLEAGSRADASPVGLVVEGCEDTPMGRFNPVRLFGAPLVLDELEVNPVKVDGDEAQVLFRVVGHLRAEDLVHEGGRARVEIGEIEVDRIERSGRLLLSRTDAGWQVACSGGR